MGTDFALACKTCFEFIDLHKWPILDEAGITLIDNRVELNSISLKYTCMAIPEISRHPLVQVTASQVREGLNRDHPDQPYIHQLLPFLHEFLEKHQEHFLFLTCDMSERPWDFGEPQWYRWKEIPAAFNFDSQFLPRNLVDDLGLQCWEDVLELYSKNEAWFLHDQLQEERESLKHAFEKTVRELMHSQDAD